jgi:hypothetical protein
MPTKKVYIMRVGNKITGQVIGDTFHKRIKTNHILLSPPGLAVNTENLFTAQNLGAIYCHITNTETNIEYWITINEFLADGFRVDRGYGLQKGLPFIRFSHSKPKEQPKLFKGA